MAKSKSELYREHLSALVEDFREAYAEAKGRGQFVPARSLFTTGLVLGELERAKIIERVGSGFRPATRRARGRR